MKFDEDYFVYKEGKQRGILVENKERGVYHGKCWPSVSSWIDYMNPDSKDLLKLLYTNPDGLIPYQYDKKDYIWDDKNVGIWIDMNEPACFEKTDKTFPKANMHKIRVWDDADNSEHTIVVEHRDVHCLYGYFSS